LGTMPTGKQTFGSKLTQFPHIDSVNSRADGRTKKKHYTNIRLREDLR
jgi:hypothetical protein